jgi:hypothetical protein
VANGVPERTDFAVKMATLAAFAQPMKPRSPVGKLARYGKIVARSQSLRPSQRASVTEYWSHEVAGVI